MQEENGDICWGRVSDDVVPVNITCVQSQPTTVFQITAYNRHVEKIFDVHIIQPGFFLHLLLASRSTVNVFITRLRDRANIEQTSSNRQANIELACPANI